VLAAGCTSDSAPPTAAQPDEVSARYTYNACSKDVTPPVITSLTATPNTLWPPNHKFVSVRVNVSAYDRCSAVQCRIVGVTSNEPVNGLGDGNTAPDWRITGRLTVDLRAERSGTGTGRVYTIYVECKDAAGNKTVKSVRVFVPHDQGRRG
jgi:hypothetical protein